MMTGVRPQIGTYDRERYLEILFHDPTRLTEILLLPLRISYRLIHSRQLLAAFHREHKERIYLLTLRALKFKCTFCFNAPAILLFYPHETLNYGQRKRTKVEKREAWKSRAVFSISQRQSSTAHFNSGEDSSESEWVWRRQEARFGQARLGWPKG